ncbi:solute carrier family 22 member 7-like [Mya arenaria]|uniref:solute carrier family 22 member 7-like n=1 Tax=Mya arenaria TaxID=6604 RepID=UPI0022E65355|nr:solute carrier family 22 member 7-like [Mya arenaria]
MTQGPEGVGIEELIEETGGCGRYQVLLSAIIHSCKCIVCFSMLFMVYGAAAPDWWCSEGIELENITSGAAFSLVCDREWISSTITSIQMAGIFVGNIACGQVADLIGRRKPFFASILALVLLNIGTAFSVSWVMFAVSRFLIGVSVGFELTVQYSLAAEFTQARWRTWVVAIPSWAIETSLFALVCWTLNDWLWIHIATAATGIPLLFTYWFVPESFRWYIGHDRIEDAKKVVQKMAQFNRKPVPKSLDYIGKGNAEGGDQKYFFSDLFKEKKLRLYTCLFMIVWMTLGITSYGIQFGVPRLSGNLFMNMFILGLASSPIQFISIWLQNRLGRKKTAWLFYGLGAAAAFAVAVTARLPDSQGQDLATNCFAITALTLVNAAWSPIQTLTIETYPTVIRNLGYGTQNTMTRIGAIIGPQLVFLETMFEVSLYWISVTALVVAMALLVPIPETGSTDLVDKIVLPMTPPLVEDDDSEEKQETTSLAERNDADVWDALYDKSVSTAHDVDVEPSVPRRFGRQVHRPHAPAETPSQNCKTNMYLPFVDHLLVDLDVRLLKGN